MSDEKKQEAQPKIRLRANVEFEHHLFESDVKNCKKNVSYKKFHPDLRDIPHKHFFHSKDQRGKSLIRCTSASGHYHECTMSMDKEGNLIVKSGPAMMDVTKKMRDGTNKTVQQQSRWETSSEQEPHLVDAHEHTWVYSGSDILSPNILERTRSRNRQEMEGEGHQVSQMVKPLAQPRPITADDGIEIREVSR